MYSDMAQKLMNNYVFQNRFRKYFYNNFEDIVMIINVLSQIKNLKILSFIVCYYIILIKYCYILLII